MVRESSGFLIKCYNYQVLGEYIEEEEFNSVITSATALAEKLYSIRRKADNKGILKYKYFLSFLSFIIMIVFFVLMYLSILSENREYEYSSYGLILGGFLIFSLLTMYEALRNSKSNVFRFKDVLKEEMDALCERENEIFRHKGVAWTFNDVKQELECRGMPEVKEAEQTKRLRQRGRQGTMLKVNQDINRKKIIEDYYKSENAQLKQNTAFKIEFGSQ